MLTISFPAKKLMLCCSFHVSRTVSEGWGKAEGAREKTLANCSLWYAAFRKQEVAPPAD